ncbi:UNVERIFIED_CONTAM: hypothetical protein K2H54_054318 [Gekko kuhli]
MFIFRYLPCLAQRVKEGTHKDIMKVAAAALLMDILLGMIADEWKLEDETACETCHIDTYWNQFFEKTHPSGDPKYPLVTKVVKKAFSLLHGTTDIESLKLRGLGMQITTLVEAARHQDLPVHPTAPTHLSTLPAGTNVDLPSNASPLCTQISSLIPVTILCRLPQLLRS